MSDFLEMSWDDVKNLSSIDIAIARGLPDGCVAVSGYEPPLALSAVEAREYRSRYSILYIDPADTVATGGRGVVTAAYDLEGKRLAVKRLLPIPETPGQTPEERSRLRERRRRAFREEFALLSRLRAFSQFPDAYGFGEIDGEPVILMEMIKGTSLERLLQPDASLHGRFTYSSYEVALMGVSLFSLLEVLDVHGKGFVHRDLSPANIIVRMSNASIEEQAVSQSFDLCLVDFGSSVLDLPFLDGQEATASMLRGTTPEYAPPEMLTDDIPDVKALRNSPKVDVYAACSILHELLVGETPFRLHDAHPADAARFKIENSPAFEAEPTTSARDVLLAILRRGLASRQELRPDAAAMHRALLSFLETCGDYDTATRCQRMPAPVDPRGLFQPAPSDAAPSPIARAPRGGGNAPASIVFVDSFEAPGDMSERQQRECRRKFAVLQLDASEPVVQGAFSARKAYTAEMRAVAVVSCDVLVAENGAPASPEVARAIAEKRLRAERNALAGLSALRGFPVVHGMGEIDGEPVLIEDWPDDGDENWRCRLPRSQ